MSILLFHCTHDLHLLKKAWLPLRVSLASDVKYISIPAATMLRVPVQRYAVRAFLYARTSGQFVPKPPAPAADPRRPFVQIAYPPTRKI